MKQISLSAFAPPTSNTCIPDAGLVLRRLLICWQAYAAHAAGMRAKTEVATRLCTAARSKRAWKAWMALVQLRRIGKAILLGYEVRFTPPLLVLPLSVSMLAMLGYKLYCGSPTELYLERQGVLQGPWQYWYSTKMVSEAIA